MILACQTLHGQITKVLGLRRPPSPPPVGKKLPNNPVFFFWRAPLVQTLPNLHLCLALLGDGLHQRGCQMHSAHTLSMAGTWQPLHHYICSLIFLHISLCYYYISMDWSMALHQYICCQIHLFFFFKNIVVLFPWPETWLEHDSLYIFSLLAIFIVFSSSFFNIIWF